MDTSELLALLESAAGGLPSVTKKRMFGCDALFASGAIFGLVWKLGRIGVRLSDDSSFATLMGRPGSDPWKAGPMTMAHWVLVPEAFHADPGELRTWVRRAHSLATAAAAAAAAAPAKKTRPVTKPATVAKKKAAAKKPKKLAKATKKVAKATKKKVAKKRATAPKPAARKKTKKRRAR